MLTCGLFVTPHDGVMLQHIGHCIQMLEPHVGVTPHDGVMLQYIGHCIQMLEPHDGVMLQHMLGSHPMMGLCYNTLVTEFKC